MSELNDQKTGKDIKDLNNIIKKFDLVCMPVYSKDYPCWRIYLLIKCSQKIKQCSQKLTYIRAQTSVSSMR